MPPVYSRAAPFRRRGPDDSAVGHPLDLGARSSPPAKNSIFFLGQHLPRFLSDSLRGTRNP